MQNLARKVWVNADQAPEDIVTALKALAEEFPVSLDRTRGAVELRFDRLDTPQTCSVSKEGECARIASSSISPALRAVGSVMSGIELLAIVK
ncbi:MAG: hypothetical protein GF410_16925 [Chitinivibrionales bacterium]|nr:hypothetical protein [Chitinivibrionales bacterium]